MMPSSSDDAEETSSDPDQNFASSSESDRSLYAGREDLIAAMGNDRTGFVFGCIGWIVMAGCALIWRESFGLRDETAAAII